MAAQVTCVAQLWVQRLLYGWQRLYSGYDDDQNNQAKTQLESRCDGEISANLEP